MSSQRRFAAGLQAQLSYTASRGIAEADTGQNGATAGADVNAPQAWARTSGRPEIVIAILDDGVQMDHPDLATNLFVNAKGATPPCAAMPLAIDPMTCSRTPQCT